MDKFNLKKYDRTFVSVDLDAIRNNLLRMKENVSGKPVMAVVKTDGYGHGAYAVARYTSDIVDGYAVATAEEALSLRRHGISGLILILGVVPEAFYEELIRAGVRMTVFTKNILDRISETALAIGRKAFIHVKVDTGMSRIGIRNTDEAVEFVKYAKTLGGIETEGIFTHFAKADNADKSASHIQYDKFNEVLCRLKKEGISVSICHCSNSAAIIDMPEYALDMVRAGIALYGLAPSHEVNIDRFGIKPAMSWYSHVAFIKRLEKGCAVSYDGTYVTERETVVATIPVGYGDGYPRALSNKGYVLIRGRKAPIIGRICMDQFMVDITEIGDVKEKDEVVLVGRSGSEVITVEDIAGLAENTFNYEIICNINKRVPRLYYLNGEFVYAAEYIDMLL